MSGVKQQIGEITAIASGASPRISVIIPSHNPPQAHLSRLHDSLKAQSLADFEIIIVDDASTRSPEYSTLEASGAIVLRLDKNGGPAAARNKGAEAAISPLLFFTDTDCALHPEALARACSALQKDSISVGDTATETSTAFGRAVALLGFPGGGVLGFDRVWRVDAEAYTRSFSSCNLAIEKATFMKLGKFNENFPVPGGEDTVLARHAVENGYKIHYEAGQIVYHVQRDTLREFVRWQIVRGRGNYYIKGHVPEVGGYLRLRVWTYWNSIRASGALFAPLVTLLWILSVLCQTYGFRLEQNKVSQQKKRIVQDES